MTKVEQDQLLTLLDAIKDEKSPDSPIWKEQVSNIKRVLFQISDHVEAIADIYKQNRVICSLFQLSIVLSVRSAQSQDISMILGNDTEVKRSLLELIDEVNNGVKNSEDEE